MKIKVSVPATSANVGSGFDALGLAVTLYNTVTFEESDHLEISSADGTRIPRNESNLVYRSAKGLFDKVGKTIPPLKIVQTNPIPMARGLGSSSACIIAGLLGANRMLGDVLNTQELLTLATSIEGHPDNVAPALLGGLTSSVYEDGVVYSVKRDVDQTLCFAAIVPDYKLLTEAARAALPKEIAHKDAVYNLSRAALVPAAFCEGRHDNVFGGEVASFHEIQPQLRAVDPLVVFDLTGQYRVAAALRCLIENVPACAATERQIFYTASGVVISHIGRGERCARLGEEL